MSFLFHKPTNCLSIQASSQMIDRISQTLGFRTIELVQEAVPSPGDQYGTGTTFYFKINGKRIFYGGANWTSENNFLATLTKDRYGISRCDPLLVRL
jgi:beta-galactosidase/beta-glucuronidase